MGLENTDARGRVDVLFYKLGERVITELEQYWGIQGIWDQCKPLMKESIKDLSARMDRTDDRITSLEERMFLMATGKTLAEALIEERIRRGLNK